MKLMTKAIEEKLPAIGSQEKVKDPMCIAKWFNPTGAGTWFAIEYDPKTEEAFGYVSLSGDHNDELGYFSLKELKEYRGMFGLGIERDLHFEPTILSKVKEQWTEK